jgi:hypothetical protein
VSIKLSEAETTDRRSGRSSRRVWQEGQICGLLAKEGFRIDAGFLSNGIPN